MVELRVAQIITRMIVGGAQQSTLQMCAGLRATGRWDVSLITGPPIGPEGELVSATRRAGVPCTVLPELRREISPTRDAAAFIGLVRLIRRLRPTIVHTHSSKAGILGRLAARAARVPLIVHAIRGLPFHPYGSRVANSAYIAAERLAARVTDHYTCVAHAMADAAVDAGIAPPERFSVVRSGIDVAAYAHAGQGRDAVRRRLCIPPDAFVIGKIARLFDLKGHRFVIAAMPRVCQAVPGARLLLVGEGILREQLLAQARELGVADRIVMAGLVPPGDVPAMIGAMDAVVHASLHEGLARVLVEALLCEKPVVSFDLDGAPEVIVDGETGRLVEAESVPGLAAALIWTARHYPRAVAMAREGRRRFAEEFSTTTTIRTMDRLYARLLRDRGLLH